MTSEVLPGQLKRFPRKDLRIQVGILCQGKYQVTTSHDIGEGGMSLFSEVALEKGLRIVASFQIPSAAGPESKFLSLLGTILSSRKIENLFFQNIQFDGLELQQKKKIRSFVASSLAPSATSSGTAAKAISR